MNTGKEHLFNKSVKKEQTRKCNKFGKFIINTFGPETTSPTK